jgi:Bacterial SH3 domain
MIPGRHRVPRSYRLYRFSGISASAASLVLAGCQSASPPAVDLAPARAAVAEARPKATTDEAKQCLLRAEEELKAAEGFAPSSSPAERQRAVGLASSAVADATCVDRLEAQGRRFSAPVEAPSGSGSNAEVERLKTRVRRSAEEQKKLEERLAILQHDLETTENEVIRTKAKLKGIETKAEASSAIAEAQTLVVRSLDQKVKSPNLTRAQEKLELAERQLRGGNYGAAAFFALQAQDLLGRAVQPRSGARAEENGAGALMVAVASANVRSEPRADAAVVTKLSRGTTVVRLGENGDWLKVEALGRTGWIAKKLVR